MDFSDFKLHQDIIEGLKMMGFKMPTPVQEQAIPAIMKGRDLIASAQTGTGKTAAFLLPVIHNIISNKKDEHIKVLIVVPTRELAVQIDQQLEGMAYFTDISSIPVYGGGDGSSFSREKQALSEGADIIIGTPGRLIAHLNLGYVKIEELECLILDEADRMLDMGFIEDIMKIVSYLPLKRQNLLFSATMPPKIVTLAKKILNNPEEIRLSISKPADRIAQVAFILYNHQKVKLVKHLLSTKKLDSILIFCSTKSSTKELARELKNSGFDVQDIHSDLEQQRRELVLNQFKHKKLNILVATDILSRGIDIEDIDLVINYDVPRDGEDYIHRIGRTARAAASGYAFTLVNEQDQGSLVQIEHLLGKPIPKAKLPASIGDGPVFKPRKANKGNWTFKRKKRKSK